MELKRCAALPSPMSLGEIPEKQWKRYLSTLNTEQRLLQKSLSTVGTEPKF